MKHDGELRMKYWINRLDLMYNASNWFSLLSVFSLVFNCCIFTLFLITFKHSDPCFLFYSKIDCYVETLKKNNICISVKNVFKHILHFFFCFVCVHNVIFFNDKRSDMLIESRLTITTVFLFYRFRQRFLTYQWRIEF